MGNAHSLAAIQGKGDCPQGETDSVSRCYSRVSTRSVSSPVVSLPSVTVLLPVLDEADHIDRCLQSLAAQDYPGPKEVVVADGGSTDGTMERLERWRQRLPGLVVIPNPDRLQSEGLNRAALEASGEVLVRADAHTTYAPDFVRRSVERVVETGAAVGGPQRPEGSTRFGEAVARAMSSPLAVGPARFRHAERLEEVDTVYLGAFRRVDLLRVGGFRTLPSGVAEDADLYFRWRRAGLRVLVDPEIRSVYRPRETPGALWRQFYRYGMGKADMLYVNGRWPSWRPAAPTTLVVGLVGGLALGLGGVWWPLGLGAGAWLAVLAAAGGGRPLVMAVAAAMHLAYGLGLLRGLARRPSRVRAAVRPPAPGEHGDHR